MSVLKTISEYVLGRSHEEIDKEYAEYRSFYEKRIRNTKKFNKFMRSLDTDTSAEKYMPKIATLADIVIVAGVFILKEPTFYLLTLVATEGVRNLYRRKYSERKIEYSKHKNENKSDKIDIGKLVEKEEELVEKIAENDEEDFEDYWWYEGKAPELNKWEDEEQ